MRFETVLASIVLTATSANAYRDIPTWIPGEGWSKPFDDDVAVVAPAPPIEIPTNGGINSVP